MTGSEITIKNVSYDDLGIIPDSFRRLGIQLEQHGDDIFIPASGRLCYRIVYRWVDYDNLRRTLAGINAWFTERFPGYSRQSKRKYPDSSKMFESRLFFVDKLIDMGAQIILCDPHRATVIGLGEQLHLRAATMSSPDIRAGIALLIAAMAAEGTSTIHNIDQIDRGYQDIDKRLNALGAKIERIWDIIV